MDANQMLKEDHHKVKELFKAFEQEPPDEAKQRIVESALMELEVHTTLEEELYYPAVRRHTGDDDLMDEADEEHLAAKRLIEDLKGMKPGDRHYDAKFTVLAESVKHHIQEEESEMLPKASRSGLDLQALGEQMAQRKQQLLREAEAPEVRQGSRHRTSRRSRSRAHAGRR